MEANLDALPEELKTHIISFLDYEAPSSSWHLHEPSSSLADSSLKPLKSLSLVSQAWRRLVKEPLFRHIRLKLVSEEAFTFHSMRPQNTPFRHAVEAKKHTFRETLLRGTGYPRDIEWAYRHSWQDTAPDKAARWIAMLDLAISSLLSFLTRADLATNVASLSLFLNKELDQGDPDYVREEMHCLIGSATFWDIIFRSFDPSQVTIVAPPSTLACLLNCSIRMLDAWAFPSMGFQLVTLKRLSTRCRRSKINEAETSYNRSKVVQFRMGPNDPARPALASLLYIRPWDHLLVNEGSYLQAYATYEYFHKEPPGIMYPLAQGFEVLLTLNSLTYQAVFPFHDYLAAAVNLMSTGILRNLNVKLGPRADDTTWDDPAHSGKVDITDCWGEIEQVYDLMFASATPGDGHLAAHSNVTRFTSGDCAIESIRELLQRSFAALDWVETEEGAWEISEAAATRRRIVQGLDDE